MPTPALENRLEMPGDTRRRTDQEVLIESEQETTVKGERQRQSL